MNNAVCSNHVSSKKLCKLEKGNRDRAHKSPRQQLTEAYDFHMLFDTKCNKYESHAPFS